MLVFCSGMLRSGSAFQYNLVCSILEKTTSCVRHGRWERRYEKITQEQLEKWAYDKNTYHIIKSGRHPWEFYYAKKGLAKIIYINRDIRDVALAAKFKWGLKGAKLFEMLDRADLSYKVMLENDSFNNKWCLHQRYEKVFYNNIEAIEQISKFFEVKLSKKNIIEIIEECSIDNMLKISNSKVLRFQKFVLNFLGRIANLIKKFLPPPYNKSWKLRKYYLPILPKVDAKTMVAPRHIEPSKGIPGAWRKGLSSEEIKTINERYKNYLIKENYLI